MCGFFLFDLPLPSFPPSLDMKALALRELPPITSLFPSLLVTVVLQAVLYGFHVSLFLLFLWIMIRFRPLHYIQLASGIFAFALSTSSVVLMAYTTCEVIEASDGINTWKYAEPRLTTTGRAIGYQFLILKIFADSVLIWRCYAIWNQSVWPCIPILLLLVLSIVLGLYSTTKAYIVDRIANCWVIAFFISCIATNIFTTFLILFKIWYETRHSPMTRNVSDQVSNFALVVAIIVQTGIIYTLALIVELVFFVKYPGSFPIIAAVNSQLSGIMPTSVIVYVVLAYRPPTLERSVGNGQLSWTSPDQPSARPSHLQEVSIYSHCG